VLSWRCIASRGLKLVFYLRGGEIFVHSGLDNLLLMRGWDGVCFCWC